MSIKKSKSPHIQKPSKVEGALDLWTFLRFKTAGLLDSFANSITMQYSTFQCLFGRVQQCTVHDPTWDDRMHQQKTRMQYHVM